MANLDRETLKKVLLDASSEQPDSTPVAVVSRMLERLAMTQGDQFTIAFASLALEQLAESALQMRQSLLSPRSQPEEVGLPITRLMEIMLVLQVHRVRSAGTEDYLGELKAAAEQYGIPEDEMEKVARLMFNNTSRIIDQPRSTPA